jgi:flagellar assembly protein FliH
MNKIISKDSGATVERWEIPSVGTPKPAAAPVLTASQLEELQQQAQQEGYQAGYQEGLAKARGEIKAKVERLERIFNLLHKPLATLDDEVEQQLLALAVAVARQIIRRELRTDPGQIVAAVREAVGSLPLAARQVRIHLHPEDAALVRGALVPAETERGWQLVDDPVLQRGDCKVLSDTSQVDASVERRLAAVAAAILARERSGEAAEARAQDGAKP